MSQKENINPAKPRIHSVQKKHDAMRTWSERLADAITNLFGSIIFFLINLILFSLWILINTGLLPLIEPFDPYPFGLLTTMVSLEAIFLSIFVLLSQKRSAKIDALREEVDLQIDIITEQELTKIMHLLVKLLEKNGIDTSKDTELQEMLKQLNTSKIERVLEQQIV
ncbi:MAG: DUF1003 domain-containing protein [Candidatus Magasanikbacteria bacterium]|nr:DUF1003 domain-containing protein [Candidatus Magasanikbacteria bacterium]